MCRLPFLTHALDLLVALVVLVAPVAVARAEEAPSPQQELRHAVESLINQLDAPALADRAHGERELIRRGPEILTYLPPPELTASASVLKLSSGFECNWNAKRPASRRRRRSCNTPEKQS